MAGNERYKIRITDPLIRAGITIEVDGVSGDYLVPTMNGLMDYIRKFNKDQKEKKESKLESTTQE